MSKQLVDFPAAVIDEMSTNALTGYDKLAHDLWLLGVDLAKMMRFVDEEMELVASAFVGQELEKVAEALGAARLEMENCRRLYEQEIAKARAAQVAPTA